MVLYDSADTFFVGRPGKEQLAALSFTFVVVPVIGSIAQAVGMEAAAAVSRAVGGLGTSYLIAGGVAAIGPSCHGATAVYWKVNRLGGGFLRERTRHEALPKRRSLSEHFVR